MDWIEVTARTVDEAKELALDRLGVVEDELEYEVVDEGRRGLLRRAEARIRARVKPISREKPNDRRRRRRPGERERSGRAGRGEGGRGEGGGGSRNGRTRTESRGGEREPSADKARREPRPAERATGEGAAAAAGPKRRRSRGGRGRGGSGGGGGGAARPTPAKDVLPETGVATERAEVEVDVEALPIAEQAAHAATFTAELVKAMGFDASVRTEIDGDDLTVHIEGDQLGALVGPRGATIQALEEVVRAVVQHHAGGHSAWVHVDVGGYRERRRAALADFARNVANDVKETGEERSLEPMSAADRKIVHDAIAEIDGVDTTSEGEEPRRRVVVFPA